VFELTPNGSTYLESTLFAFKGGKDGRQPYSAPLIGAAGALYGTTVVGGSGPCAGAAEPCTN
jgi:hypothetical protein